MSSPLGLVKQRYKLPIELYPFQEEAVNFLAPLHSAGLYFDVGLGKTITATTIALFKKLVGEIACTICIMPPVLITGWSRTLSKIEGVTHVCYRGSPKQRAEINLKGVDFILVGYQIFKRDQDYLQQEIGNKTILVMCDEAQAIKNVASRTHRAVRDFSVGNQILLLTGTPLSSPDDGYAFVRMIAPHIYLSLKQFEDIHVDERDFYDRPIKWKNLDLLNENLRVRSVRLMKRDVLKDLPPVTYQEIPYDLTPQHLKLYNRIAEEQIAMLPDGAKLDMTQTSALYYALAQIPCNGEHFSGGEVQSTILELIDEVMDELGGKKLVIFTQFVMTNRRLLEHCKQYGAVAIYGEISPTQKQANIDRFVSDPTCRVMLLQYAAGGAGIDNMQYACSDILAVELPFRAGALHQAVGRLDRVGQKEPVTVRIAIPEKTITRSIYKNLLDNDSIVNRCIRSLADLRDVIRGCG